MGFFSWKTQDEGKTIPNQFSGLATYKVYMIDNKGNVWIEENYEGYGVFGGKDYYELLSEMNGDGPDRSRGIELAFPNFSSGGDHTEGVLYPNLFRWKEGNGTAEDWIKAYDPKGPESCEFQGYFYEQCERCGETYPEPGEYYSECPECGYDGRYDGYDEEE